MDCNLGLKKGGNLGRPEWWVVVGENEEGTNARRSTGNVPTYTSLIQFKCFIHYEHISIFSVHWVEKKSAQCLAFNCSDGICFFVLLHPCFCCLSCFLVLHMCIFKFLLERLMNDCKSWWMTHKFGDSFVHFCFC